MEFKDLKNKFLDFLYPEGIKCVICDEELFDDNPYFICDECFNTLPRIEKFCERCGNYIHENDLAKVCNSCKGKELYFEQARAPFEYKDKIAFLIQKLKFSNGKYLAKPLATLLADEVQCFKYKPEIIIPVPMTDKKKKIRGFNQCELLANELSKISQIETSFDVVYKIKETKEQMKLGFSERQENLNDCFVVKNNIKIKDKIVLLVDDVYTTGATAINISKVLMRAGARKVLILTIAHTVFESNK